MGTPSTFKQQVFIVIRYALDERGFLGGQAAIVGAYATIPRARLAIQFSVDDDKRNGVKASYTLSHKEIE